MTKIFISGAAGNLGGLLAKYFAENESVKLNLFVHKKDIGKYLQNKKNINVFRGDLAMKKTIEPALKDVDIVIHFAGILFKHHPENFLPVTNTLYFKNLVDVAIEQKVKRIILISFPHVEGESTPGHPATGRLDGNPVSVHAKTRLEEEKLLFEAAKRGQFEPVSLRVGMVYGKGILMIEGARWFARHGLLGIWKKPTQIHLISAEDFLAAMAHAILKENIRGIYHLGDEGIQTLQEFLDAACMHWGYKKPVRMPVWFILFAAWHFELFSLLFGTRSPLTRDFIRIGMVSYYGDTRRMREELLPELRYRDFREGMGRM